LALAAFDIDEGAIAAFLMELANGLVEGGRVVHLDPCLAYLLAWGIMRRSAVFT
jgi:hypothetical protein